MKDLIIIGCGGYAQEVAWVMDARNALAPEWRLFGFLDLARPDLPERYVGYPVLREPEDLAALPADLHFACGIGEPDLRRRTVAAAEARGWHPATLIHPSAILAPGAQVGEGTILGAFAVLAPNCTVGRHSALNLHVSVGHDSRVGDFCVLSPGARIGGWARVEEGCLLGTNASVAPRRTLGANSRLGMNSALMADARPGSSLLGIPARAFLPGSPRE